MMRTLSRQSSLPVSALLLTLLAFTVMLEPVPALWWDEGWTMLTARNWVQSNHYGQFSNGNPAPAGLTASFPVVAPVALSFNLFGAGVWQARLPGVLFSLGALSLLYIIGRALYNPRVAVAGLALLFLLPVSPDLHPLMVGRQVLGEMPLMFYLLAGYAFLYLALKRSTLYLLAAIFFWGIALKTKAQAPPFWFVSLLLPLAAAILAKQWKAALLLALGLAGGWAWGEWSIRLAYAHVVGPTIAGGRLEGLYDVTAIVPDFNVRLAAWGTAFTAGLPVIAGILYAAWNSLKRLRRPGFDGVVEFTRLALLGLSGSWFFWYAALAMSWQRYLFPAFFTGCLFAAYLFHDLSDGFRFKRHFLEAARLLAEARRGASAAFEPFLRQFRGILVAAWIGAAGIMTFTFLALQFTLLADGSVVDVAAYLNDSSDPGALVESYESEVFFFLDRPYHYPPDQVHVALNRRWMIDPDTPVDYDPLAADPDYLVVGRMGRQWALYEPVLAQGAFRLVFEAGPYEVYERVRR